MESHTSNNNSSSTMPHEEEGMEFSQEHDEPENNEPDHELLQLQKRKSTPKVIIQEFVQNFNSDDESDDDDEIPDETKNAAKPEVPAQTQVKKASIKEKEKTHYEIDNVSASLSQRETRILMDLPV